MSLKSFSADVFKMQKSSLLAWKRRFYLQATGRLFQVTVVFCKQNLSSRCFFTFVAAKTHNLAEFCVCTHQRSERFWVVRGLPPYSDILPDKCISAALMWCVSGHESVCRRCVHVTVCEVCTVDHQRLIQSLKPLWTTEASLSESTRLRCD